MIISKLGKIITICLILLTITGCGVLDKTPDITNGDLNEFAEIVEDTEIKMYEDIIVDFNEMSITEIDETLKSSDGATQYYFYFGRTTCLYCRKFIIENVDPLKNLQHFFYINTEDFAEDESSILSNYGIELIPAILTATNSEDIKSIDIEEFTKEIHK